MEYVVVLVVAGAVLALLFWRVLVRLPREADHTYEAETQRWVQTGVYPPEVARSYRSPSTGTADALRLQPLGYRVASLTWGRAGVRITWRRAG